MEFNEIIKMLRDEHGLTQQQVAERLCISAQAVSKWENGSSMPDVSAIPNIAKLYDVSTDYLFGLTNEIREDPLNRYVKEIQQALEKEDTEEAFHIIIKVSERFPNDYKLKEELIKLIDVISNFNSKLYNKYDEMHQMNWSPSSIKEYEEMDGEKFTLDPGEKIITDEEYDEIKEKWMYYTDNDVSHNADKVLTELTEDIVKNSGDKEQSAKMLTKFVELCNETGQQEKARELVDSATPIDHCREVLSAMLTQSFEDNKNAMYKELWYFLRQSFKAYDYKIFLKTSEEERDNIFKDTKRIYDIMNIIFDDEEYGEFGQYVYPLLINLGFICSAHYSDNDKAQEYYRLAENVREDFIALPENGTFGGGFFRGMPLRFKTKSGVC